MIFDHRNQHSAAHFPISLFVICLIYDFCAPGAMAIPACITLENSDKNITTVPTAKTSFTPLLLPNDATARGISLSGDAKLCRVDHSSYRMSCGIILVHTDEPIVISTCRANVFIRAGATIVVGAGNEVTRILNLSDHKRDSVRVIFKDRHIALNPGEELAVVSASAPDAEKIATEETVGFRNAQSFQVSPEYKGVLFEFSLADAMKYCLIFKQLKESPFEEDKVLLHEIIKTAAAVNTLFAKTRDKYTHGNDKAIATKNHNAKIARKGKPPARLASNINS